MAHLDGDSDGYDYRDEHDELAGYGTAEHEAELIAWEREVGDRYEGDPRRCSRHPEVRTSSPDGMFDDLCGLCESLMDLEAEAA